VTLKRRSLEARVAYYEGQIAGLTERIAHAQKDIRHCLTLREFLRRFVAKAKREARAGRGSK